jgi:hypothetical protein
MPITNNELKLKGSLIRCPNSNCQYTWIYSGRFLYYATCPSCRRNVKIEENKISSPESAQVAIQGQIPAVDNTPVEADAG